MNMPLCIIRKWMHSLCNSHPWVLHDANPSPFACAAAAPPALLVDGGGTHTCSCCTAVLHDWCAMLWCAVLCCAGWSTQQCMCGAAETTRLMMTPAITCWWLCWCLVMVRPLLLHEPLQRCNSQHFDTLIKTHMDASNSSLARF